MQSWLKGANNNHNTAWMLRCLDISSAKLISPPSWTQTYRQSESVGKLQSDSSSLVGLWVQFQMAFLFPYETSQTQSLLSVFLIHAWIHSSYTRIALKFCSLHSRFLEPTALKDSWTASSGLVIAMILLLDTQLSSRSVSMSWQNTWECGTREVGFILTYGSGPCNWWAASMWWSKVFS